MVIYLDLLSARNEWNNAHTSKKYNSDLKEYLNAWEKYATIWKECKDDDTCYNEILSIFMEDRRTFDKDMNTYIQRLLDSSKEILSKKISPDTVSLRRKIWSIRRHILINHQLELHTANLSKYDDYELYWDKYILAWNEYVLAWNGCKFPSCSWNPITLNRLERAYQSDLEKHKAVVQEVSNEFDKARRIIQDMEYDDPQMYTVLDMDALNWNTQNGSVSNAHVSNTQNELSNGLQNVSMSNARLNNASVSNVQNASMSNARLNNGLQQNGLNNASMSNAQNASMSNAGLNDARLNNASVSNVQNESVSNARLNNASMSNAQNGSVFNTQNGSVSMSNAQNGSVSMSNAQNGSVSMSNARLNNASVSNAQNGSMFNTQNGSVSMSNAQNGSVSMSNAQNGSVSMSNARLNNASVSNAQNGSMFNARLNNASVSKAQNGLSNGLQQNAYIFDALNNNPSVWNKQLLTYISYLLDWDKSKWYKDVSGRQIQLEVYQSNWNSFQEDWDKHQSGLRNRISNWDEYQLMWDTYQSAWLLYIATWEEYKDMWETYEYEWDKFHSSWDKYQSSWDRYQSDWDTYHQSVLKWADYQLSWNIYQLSWNMYQELWENSINAEYAILKLNNYRLSWDTFKSKFNNNKSHMRLSDKIVFAKSEIDHETSLINFLRWAKEEGYPLINGDAQKHVLSNGLQNSSMSNGQKNVSMSNGQKNVSVSNVHQNTQKKVTVLGNGLQNVSMSNVHQNAQKNGSVSNTRLNNVSVSNTQKNVSMPNSRLNNGSVSNGHQNAQKNVNASVSNTQNVLSNGLQNSSMSNTQNVLSNGYQNSSMSNVHQNAQKNVSVSNARLNNTSMSNVHQNVSMSNVHQNAQKNVSVSNGQKNVLSNGYQNSSVSNGQKNVLSNGYQNSSVSNVQKNVLSNGYQNSSMSNVHQNAQNSSVSNAQKNELSNDLQNSSISNIQKKVNSSMSNADQSARMHAQIGEDLIRLFSLEFRKLEKKRDSWLKERAIWNETQSNWVNYISAWNAYEKAGKKCEDAERGGCKQSNLFKMFKEDEMEMNSLLKSQNNASVSNGHQNARLNNASVSNGQNNVLNARLNNASVSNAQKNRSMSNAYQNAPMRAQIGEALIRRSSLEFQELEAQRNLWLQERTNWIENQSNWDDYISAWNAYKMAKEKCENAEHDGCKQSMLYKEVYEGDEMEMNRLLDVSVSNGQKNGLNARLNNASVSNGQNPQNNSIQKEDSSNMISGNKLTSESLRSMLDSKMPVSNQPPPMDDGRFVDIGGGVVTLPVNNTPFSITLFMGASHSLRTSVVESDVINGNVQLVPSVWPTDWPVWGTEAFTFENAKALYDGEFYHDKLGLPNRVNRHSIYTESGTQTRTKHFNSPFGYKYTPVYSNHAIDQNCFYTDSVLGKAFIGNNQAYACDYWSRMWHHQAMKRQLGSVEPILYKNGSTVQIPAIGTVEHLARNLYGRTFDDLGINSEQLAALEFSPGVHVFQIHYVDNGRRNGQQIFTFFKQLDNKNFERVFRTFNRWPDYADGRPFVTLRDTGDLTIRLNLIAKLNVTEIQASADFTYETTVYKLRYGVYQDRISMGYDEKHRDVYLDPSVLSYDYLMRLKDLVGLGKLNNRMYEFHLPAEHFITGMPTNAAKNLIAKSIGIDGRDVKGLITGSVDDNSNVTKLVSIFRTNLINGLSRRNGNINTVYRVANFYTGVLSLMYLSYHGVLPDPEIVFQGDPTIFASYENRMGDNDVYLYAYTNDIAARLFGDTFTKFVFKYIRAVDQKYVLPAEIFLHRVYTILAPFAGVKTVGISDLDEDEILGEDMTITKLPVYVDIKDSSSDFFKGMDRSWKRAMWNRYNMPNNDDVDDLPQRINHIADEYKPLKQDIDEIYSKYYNRMYDSQKDKQRFTKVPLTHDMHLNQRIKDVEQKQTSIWTDRFVELKRAAGSTNYDKPALIKDTKTNNVYAVLTNVDKPTDLSAGNILRGFINQQSNQTRPKNGNSIYTNKFIELVSQSKR